MFADVIHSCQTVKDLMDTDNLFRENVQVAAEGSVGSDVIACNKFILDPLTSRLMGFAFKNNTAVFF